MGRLAAISAVLGVLLALGSLVLVDELHPASHIIGEGYAGDARAMGAPWPYFYVLTSDLNADAMRVQAHCRITPFCVDYAEVYPQSDPFSLTPFLADVMVWSVVAAAPLIAVARPRKRPIARVGTAEQPPGMGNSR